MRRRTTLTLAAAALLLAALAAPADAAPGGAVPAGSRAFGGSSLAWQQAWIEWVFGSSTNPLLAETLCGETVDGVYFLTGAMDAGQQRHCRIPTGTPLLAAPGGTVAWWGVDGTSAAQLLAARDALIAPFSDVRVVLDGREIPVDGTYAESGVYPIDMEPGNFMETLGIPVVEDPLRVASAGWFVRIRPLPPGERVLVLSSDFAGSPADITFHLEVVPGASARI